jgi:hypothetical protein
VKKKKKGYNIEIWSVSGIRGKRALGERQRESDQEIERETERSRKRQS